MDVKSTFLNGVLKEEVYVMQPLGYEIERQEDKVYQLRKALYGLNQAPHALYNRIDAYLLTVSLLSTSKRAKIRFSLSSYM